MWPFNLGKGRLIAENAILREVIAQNEKVISLLEQNLEDKTDLASALEVLLEEAEHELATSRKTKTYSHADFYQTSGDRNKALWSSKKPKGRKTKR